MGITPNPATERQLDYLLKKFSQENQYTKVLREKGVALREAQQKYFKMRGITPEKEQQLSTCKKLEEEFDRHVLLKPEEYYGVQQNLFQ